MNGGADITEGSNEAGGIWPQFIIALPYPSDNNKHIYFYQTEDFLTGVEECATHLRYCIIDKSLNNGLGKVIQKDILVIQDTLPVGNLTAVRHANGRDWWLITNEIYSNRFYRILISSDGVTLTGSQTVGSTVKTGVGQSVFSPDGTHYARYYTVSTQVGAYLEVYDFDRCTGLLSNHHQYHFINRGWGGLAFSPNSRYLYVNYEQLVFQYDMQAEDIFASPVTVATWDGYTSPYPTRFFFMQLAPDGKIYSATTTGSNVLHVIQRPDEPGLSCRYEQHAIHLPTYNSLSIPNFPNYRLGPLDGSACDTLDLDNVPVAWFRYDRDTLDAWSVEFRDLSYYAPDSWSWDFGDGSAGSTEQHPWHTFTESGNYTVCLTVSNENSSDTYCRTLFVGVSGSEEIAIEQSNIAIIPNPANDYLRITGLSLADGQQASIALLDVNGKRVTEHTLSADQAGIATHSLPEGIYFCRIMVDHQLVAIRRVVILH